MLLQPSPTSASDRYIGAYSTGSSVVWPLEVVHTDPITKEEVVLMQDATLMTTKSLSKQTVGSDFRKCKAGGITYGTKDDSKTYSTCNRRRVLATRRSSTSRSSTTRRSSTSTTTYRSTSSSTTSKPACVPEW